ncbi:MAG TPA: NAD(P)H-dependent oxidoreductase subunit E [Candidatus Dormibacteraeota bacterium]|nr:NAD(P)H-dependent oxidoreductase subunit E [Candidatus Dormibacteraeota bacterium]
MSALSEHVLEEIRELPAKYPQPRSAVMPALDLAQEEVGYLTPEAMSEVAAALQLDPGYLEGVATFYTLFHLQPIGKHRFYVCTNLSCTLRGANEIVEHVKTAIGVHEPEQVSKDGLFSYEEVECLGACEYAPVMRLDHRYQKDLTPQKVDALIAERRNPNFSAPADAVSPAPPATPAGPTSRKRASRTKKSV